MKKVFNFFKNNIIICAIIMLLLLVALECILGIFNLRLRQNVIYACIILIVLEVVIGIIQLYKRKEKTTKKVIIIVACILVILLIIFWKLILFIFAFMYAPEHIVYKDGKKYVAYVYSFLNTNVEYYDYINNFVIGKNKRILEIYDDVGRDVLADTKNNWKPSSTIYYDKNGKNLDTIDKLNTINDTKLDDTQNTSTENNKIEDYLGTNISYEKAMELLKLFTEQYKNQLVNSETSGNTNNTGIYIYYSETSSSDSMLKDAIVDSIKSYITSRQNEPEGTYSITEINNDKYGKGIYVIRNEMKILRTSFKIEDNSNENDNYKKIETFNEILNSQKYISDINKKYEIDVKNRIKIWSLVKNNFIMNIGCDDIEKDQYNDYASYIFDTFKKMIEESYNTKVTKIDKFIEITQ